MDTLPPHLLILVVMAIFCIGFIYAAREAFRYELMARGRLLAILAVLVVVLSLVAYYFAYVLGGPTAVEPPPR